MSGWEVWLVEDNAADVYLFRKAIGHAQLACALTVLEDGEKLLQSVRSVERCERRLPNVIVLDLNLPRRNGARALEDIRASTAFDRVAIVILSSSPSPAGLPEAERLAIREYIVKPMSLDEYMRIGHSLKAILELSAPEA